MILDQASFILDALYLPLTNKHVKLYTEKFGKHPIDNISGSFSKKWFYNYESEEGLEDSIYVKLSNRDDDKIDIDKRRMSTAYLGINTIAISQPKYAERAVEKLKGALQKVSETRSYFGSIQNRIEHAIANNDNKAENTQAAESLIRDADMATLAMENARLNILEQVGSSIMSSQKQRAQDVLSLLG